MRGRKQRRHDRSNVAILTPRRVVTPSDKHSQQATVMACVNDRQAQYVLVGTGPLTSTVGKSWLCAIGLRGLGRHERGDTAQVLKLQWGWQTARLRARAPFRERKHAQRYDFPPKADATPVRTELAADASTSCCNPTGFPLKVNHFCVGRHRANQHEAPSVTRLRA